MALSNFIKASAQFCCKYSWFFWLAVLTDLLFWVPELQARSSQERCCCQRGQVITWEFLSYVCIWLRSSSHALDYFDPGLKSLLTELWTTLAWPATTLMLLPDLPWPMGWAWRDFANKCNCRPRPILGNYPCWLLPLLALTLAGYSVKSALLIFAFGRPAV